MTHEVDIMHYCPGAPEEGPWNKEAICGEFVVNVAKEPKYPQWALCPKCVELLEIRAIIADTHKVPTRSSVDMMLGTRNLVKSDIPDNTYNWLLTGEGV